MRAQVTTLVSAQDDGTVAGNYSRSPSMSADGRYVAFMSQASDLLPFTISGQQVYRRDIATGAVALVSADSNELPGSAASDEPSISADGSAVAFQSNAANLVVNDTNGVRDIFLRDVISNVTSRVSIATDGSEANGESAEASLSAAGTHVAFTSEATNLVAGDNNVASDIFVHDIVTGETTLESVSLFGGQGDQDSGEPSMSADGRFVAFSSSAITLVPNDTNGMKDVFVRDRLMGSTTRVSVSSVGVQSDGISYRPYISGDGRYVAFGSTATNLVVGDSNGTADVFVHDLQTNETSRVSIASTGDEADGSLSPCGVSADGRYILFFGTATTLVPDDTNGEADVFLHDRVTAVTIRVSVASFGEQADGASGPGKMSDDARFVAFASWGQLVAVDMNQVQDVYLVDLDPFEPWDDLGNSLPGQHGAPALFGAGSANPLTIVSVTLSGALEDTQAVLVLGSSAVHLVFKGGVLVPDAQIVIPLVTDAAGSIVLNTLWPPNIPSGLTAYMQYWIVDPAGSVGYAASNGLSLTVP
jgi:Tol biopolymer transport system component